MTDGSTKTPGLIAVADRSSAAKVKFGTPDSEGIGALPRLSRRPKPPSPNARAQEPDTPLFPATPKQFPCSVCSGISVDRPASRAATRSHRGATAAGALKPFKFPIHFFDNENSALRAIRWRLGPPPATLSPPCWRTFSWQSRARRGHAGDGEFSVRSSVGKLRDDGRPTALHSLFAISPVPLRLAMSPRKRQGPRSRASMATGSLNGSCVCCPQQRSVIGPVIRQRSHPDQSIRRQIHWLVTSHDPLHDVRRQEGQLDHPRHVRRTLDLLVLRDRLHDVTAPRTQSLKPVVRLRDQGDQLCIHRARC